MKKLIRLTLVISMAMLSTTTLYAQKFGRINAVWTRLRKVPTSWTANQ